MSYKKFGKKGELLVENVIFIILNLVFLSIIVLFLVQQGNSVGELEETYSKKAALMIDSAEPVMKIKFDMRKGLEKINKKELDFENALEIKNNKVIVSLSNDSYFDYHFFNDVSVSSYPDKNNKNEYTGLYVLVINEKQGGENVS
ncbi:MAG TPA: hypothetical protein VJ912_00780 [Candidatus Nanoarchaeia archaeon]|nr:hypothetical protein [Candidatus Nanoarchaeia archaeon]